jgi:type IV pilus assembly protein PilQ
VHLSCANAPAKTSVSDIDDEFDTDLADNSTDSKADDTAGTDDLDADLDSDTASATPEADQPLDSELDESGQADNAAPLSGEDDKFAESEPDAETPAPVPEDSGAMDEGTAQAEPPAPSVPEESEPSPVVGASDAQPVEITGLDFRAKESGGTVVIATSGTPSYTTRVNPDNQQFVVEVQNAQLPSKFKRPYNTKEFTGSISGIQAYQSPGSKTARIVVQMRDGSEPQVRLEGNSILVSPSEESLAAQGESSVGPGEEAAQPTQSALTNQNIDAFLLGQSKFYGRKISIQFRDADIRDVFNFISEESGLNIILTDDVTGKISLKLRQVPWDQALIVIMKAKQLGYVRQGNVLRISGLAALQKESDAARTVLESQSKLRPLKVKVFPVSYAKVSDLETQAKEFLSERGKVKGDTRTNSLVVNDLEENIEKVGRLIEILDTETPQVLIESKIIEARDDFARRVGLSWTLQNGNIPLGNINGTPLSLVPTVQMQADTAAPINAHLQIGTFDFLGDVDATLNLYESEGIVRVISAPRIVTLNGVKATIEQTTELPYKKTDTTTAGTTTTVQFKPVALKLDVSPQITADGGVIMNVQVQRQFPGADVGDGNFPINTRSASTTLLVRNGQTTVLGGIYQSDVSDSESGVPFLRRLPIIGSLFRSNSIQKQKNELMIFMTPRILNKDRAFRQQAKGDS